MNATRALLRRLLRPETAAWEPLTPAMLTLAHSEQVPGALAEAARRKHAARALALPRQLAELDALLGETGTLLKGSAYSFSLYDSEPGVRTLSDIDLLVSAAEAERLRAQLADRGWRVLAGYDNYLYLPGQAMQLPLDLHTDIVCADRLAARAALNRAPGTRELLAARQPLPGYRHLAVLSPAAQGMTMLLHHMLHHGFRGVKWWLDFHRWWNRHAAARLALLEESPPAWRPLIAYGIWWYQRLSGVELPEAMTRALRREYRAFWPWYFDRVLAGGREAPLRYLAAFAWLPREQWAQYARELVLPDGESLRAYYGMGGSTAALRWRHWRESARLLW